MSAGLVGMRYVVAVEGLSVLETLRTIPAEVTRAARMAVNRTTEWSRTLSARRMREQVNFPASYLTGSDPRLSIIKRASDDDLSATIEGRFRPTSLARFATAGRPGKSGVTVNVSPGGSRRLKRAFLIRLRAGKADMDTKSNLGLAIRLKPGETIANKKRMIRADRNLYLLYGPSVDQVFRGVAEDVSPEIGDRLENEFSRLVDLKL